MTDQEIIDVVKAHQNGKLIQYKGTDGIWHDCIDKPMWDFRIDYRVKPELKYRPYKNAEELDEAIKEHGLFIANKTHGGRSIISKYGDVEFQCGDSMFLHYSVMLDRFTWLDGTP